MNIKDKLWIWGHPVNSLKGSFGITKDSDVSPMEGAKYLGANNIFYVPMGRKIDRSACNEEMKDVAREIPLDKLVLETDSPYLTPVPFRGKENKPAYVRYVAEEIAKIRDVSVEEIIDITTRNAEEFFCI